MRYASIITALFCAAVFVPGPVAAADKLGVTADGPPMQVRVFIDASDQWEALLRTDPDIMFYGDGYVDIVADHAAVRELRAIRLDIKIIHHDLPAFYRSRMTDRGMGDYKTLAEINAYLDGIIADHPDIVSPKENIGLSIEGRPLWAVKISDNPLIDEDEPEVLYTACIHAREVITPEVLFHFMDYLTDEYSRQQEVTTLVDNRELWFVVMVNPDGYYHNELTDPGGGGMWRKNRRDNLDGTFGVDLNRNWGYMWGANAYGSSGSPGSDVYRGTEPFSEPETANLGDFILAHDFTVAVNYHSHSNLILWPWDYQVRYTLDHDVFSAIGRAVSALNGYAPSPGWGLYVADGTADDWAYGDQGIFSFTIEVGNGNDGFWPPAARIDDLVEENLEPNLYFAEVAGDIYALRAPNRPIVDCPLWAEEGDPVDVTWTHDDQENPAAAYELIELQDLTRFTDAADALDHWESQGFSVSTDDFYSSGSSFFSGTESCADSYIQTKNPLKVHPDDTLEFWINYDTINFMGGEDIVYGYVEVSTDGRNFESIPGNITTTDNPTGNNRGHGFTGESGGWVKGIFDLSAYAGQDAWVRIAYSTVFAWWGEGFYIDDIQVIEAFGSEAVIASDLTDTHYTFTDLPLGTYYYRVRAEDEEGDWGVISDTRSTLVYDPACCVGIRGNVNSDPADQIDISDVVFLVNYLYHMGPTPACPLEANVDGSPGGTVDHDDIDYLIDYIFRGGPAPVACP